MAKDPQGTGTIDLFGKLQDNSRRQTVRMDQSQQVGANQPPGTRAATGTDQTVLKGIMLDRKRILVTLPLLSKDQL
jgi:hypothetical protein